jgi:hypothetical protein
MCKESKMAYAAINNCAACSCLEKSDKIIMAQMWVKTSSVCVCVFSVGSLFS